MSIIDNGAWQMSLTGTRGDETDDEFPIEPWASDPRDVHADTPCEFRIPGGVTVRGYSLHLGPLTWNRGPVLNYEHFFQDGSYTLTVPRDAFRLALAHWVDTGQWDHTKDRARTTDELTAWGARDRSIRLR